MSYDPKKSKHRHQSHHTNPQARRAMRLYQSGAARTLRSAWRKVKSGGARRVVVLDPKRSRTGRRGGRYFISTKRGGGHKRRYDPARRRRHDPMRLKVPGGVLGKLVAGVVKTLGGNVGEFVGAAESAAMPQYSVALGGKSFSLPAEITAIAVGTAGEYVPGLVDDFLSGMAGGIAAGGDPPTAPQRAAPMTGAPATAGPGMGSPGEFLVL